MKSKFLIISTIILLASCKQTLYTEIGMGGAGKLVVKSSDLTLPKKQNDHQVAITGETKAVSTDYNLVGTTKQSIQYKTKGLTHESKSKFKCSFRKLKSSIKQGLKLIPKVKSMNRQEVKQTLKNQKQIFGYEGDNEVMTIGFNILLYSIIIGLGLIFLGFLLGKNAGLLPFILGLGTFGFGGLIGLGIWLLGALISLMS